MNTNKVETRLREIAERENSIPKERFIRDRNCVYATVPTNPPKYFRGELQLANRFSLVVHGLNRESIGSTGCETLAEFITNAPSDIRWLLALIKKQREALEAVVNTSDTVLRNSGIAWEGPFMGCAHKCRDALNFSPENL